MISERHRCVFVHIPKTAGESIETFFLGKPLNTPEDPRVSLPSKHASLAEILADHPHVRDGYLSFTVVRNPWDRYVSYLSHAHRERERFTEDELRTQMRRMLFHPFYLRRSTRNMICLDGRVAVDHVLRFERLGEDFRRLCAALGIEGELSRHNPSSHRHYSSYFDPWTRECLRAIHRWEIEEFSHLFTADGAVVRRHPVLGTLASLFVGLKLRWARAVAKVASHSRDPATSPGMTP
jgi:hypothetical protein